MTGSSLREIRLKMGFTALEFAVLCGRKTEDWTHEVESADRLTRRVAADIRRALARHDRRVADERVQELREYASTIEVSHPAIIDAVVAMERSQLLAGETDYADSAEAILDELSEGDFRRWMALAQEALDVRRQFVRREGGNG